MINLEGGFVFGASYLVPAKLGRGRSEEEIALLDSHNLINSDAESEEEQDHDH